MAPKNTNPITGPGLIFATASYPPSSLPASKACDTYVAIALTHSKESRVNDDDWG